MDRLAEQSWHSDAPYGASEPTTDCFKWNEKPMIIEGVNLKLAIQRHSSRCDT